MKILAATETLARKHAQEIADLVFLTGPVSYSYQFGTKSVIDRVVTQTVHCAGTLFGWDGLYLAMDGDELLGILYLFPAIEYRPRIATLSSKVMEMVKEGQISEDEFALVVENTNHAQWLNPVMRPNICYVHAIAVKPEHKGQKIGLALIHHAEAVAKENEFGALELDVLSDNPAVHFYKAWGLEILAETTAPKPSAYGIPPEYRMGKTF